MNARFETEPATNGMRYEGNQKHRDPWQPGRKGSLCPNDLNQQTAQQLLDNSVPDGDKRYAIYAGRAYCAQQHDADRWHGYPIGWVEVPERIRRNWQTEKLVQRRDVRKHWKQ